MSIDNSHKIEDVKILLAKGIDGVGIEKIEKTGSSGIVDTYTITYTDSRKTTFEITNGNGIESIEKTSTVLLNDVYTITYEDGSTTTYNVTNGRGIDRIEKTGTSGAVDTYTIYYNDNTTSTYTVTNGQGAVAGDISFTNNGEGATNVQDAVDNTLKLVAPIQLTLTADKTYNVGDQFVYEGLLYEVTATIASGTSITIGSNCQLTDTVAEQLTAINSNLSSYPDFLGEGAGGASGSITLNAPITNYRLLLFVFKAGYGTIEMTTECIPSNIASSFSSAIRVGYYNGNHFSEFDCTYTSDTTFTFTEFNTASPHSICIYGVK